MSKFFKALENAERERDTDRGESAPAVTTSAPAVTTAAPAPAPAAPAPSPVVVVPPPPRPTVVEAVAPAPPAAPVVVIPPPARRAVVPLPVRADVAPAPTAQTLSAPPAPRAAAYGAPLAREDSESPAQNRAFRSLLDPEPADEPGAVDDHLVSLLEPTSLAAEQYRAVRLHIETLHRERNLRLLAMSSPSRGDGKTLSAINVAGALAQAPDARVVLVEVDMRNPGVAEYLGVPGRRGLSSYLMDPAMSVDAVLERPPGIGFSLIVAGPVSSMPYELLKSPRLGALLRELRERFDYVVVDTPPVLPFPDTGILRELVDGFVLVVRANRTPRELVRDAIGTLGERRVLGVIFNDDERTAVDQGADGGWRRLARPLGTARG
jgi:capsular exopolysaccharide synthesis family protein